ncbi:hypothetical protein EHS25_003250 [Saitozyma podzolica]|uniref:6-phosphogluconate dehydrogenase NADP-binding domain-containing protein n=1 Tax=Saitozyma podzolica TaxID=1890683 RepID=A0A427Y8C5_9TREE|nr:hypothetical protein EHS25_003250 [Saitozyma podzolica]
MSYKIGFIGLGALGTPIAINLASYAKENNFPFAVWNRSPEKYSALKEAGHDEGVFFASRPEELVERCNLIFTVLVNDQAAEEVYGKLIGAVRGKVVFADVSTLLPKTSKKLEVQAKEKGAIYLATPVFGQPVAAKAKQLINLVSGAKEGREYVSPIFPAIGKKVIDVGEDVGKGTSLKLLGNQSLLGIIQVFSEVYTLADAIGFDLETVHELYESMIPAPSVLNYSNKLSHGTFGGPGFSVTTGLKDASHIASLRDDLENPFPLPTLETATANLTRAKDLGLSHLDWSALSLPMRQDAKLSLFKEGTDEGRKPPPPM